MHREVSIPHRDYCMLQPSTDSERGAFSDCAVSIPHRDYCMLQPGKKSLGTTIGCRFNPS